MTDKKQLHKQAILLSLNIFLAGLVLPLLMFKEEYLVALIPALVLIAIIIIINYVLKPDISRYIKIHSILGFITSLVCFLIVFIFTYGAFFISLLILKFLSFLSVEILTNIEVKLLYLLMNLYFIVPLISFLTEIGVLVKQRLYKKPKEFLVLITSNAGICVLITYIVVLFIVGSNI